MCRSALPQGRFSERSVLAFCAAPSCADRQIGSARQLDGVEGVEGVVGACRLVDGVERERDAVYQA
jgi:hypothetical protein